MAQRIDRETSPQVIDHEERHPDEAVTPKTSLTIRTRIRENNANFQRRLKDLGFFDSMGSMSPALNTVFQAFHDAPPEVVCILRGRIITPGRTPEKITSLREPVEDMATTSTPTETLETYTELQALIKTFASIKDDFYARVRELWHYHYRNKHVGPLEWQKPFPEVTQAFISIAQSICLLREIRSRIPQREKGTLKLLADNIDQTLNRSELRPFIERASFLRVATEHPNPFLFADPEVVQQLASERFIYPMWHAPFLEEATELLSADDGMIARARAEFQSLAAIHEDFWDTGRERPDGEPHGRHKHPHLRQFLDGIMNSTLA